MDAFYASVEELDHPEYRGRPLIIGADPKGGHGRGVVSTANYVARQFGVISAQPVSQAFRLCPQGIFIPPRIQRYVQLSRQVMEILEGFSPVVEQVGIDEAFLDCTGTERLFGPSTKLGRRIKSAIRDGTELTASVGIAPNKYIAKVASDLEKPDGLTICAPGKEREFLAKLPIERLWGAGKKTVARLKTLGYWQIGDLGRASIEQVQRELGNWGEHFWRLANGLDDRPVQRGWRRKSISEETTFAVDISDEERIERALFEIAETLTHNMRQEGARGRTITLKIRLQGFETFTRSHTVADPTDETRLIRATALRLFRNFDRKDKAVRLIGIGVSNLRFADEPHKARSAQMDLFGELAARPAPGGDSDARSDPKDRKRDELFDRLKNRFGNHVKRGSLM
jgi:nucleotidyltransferase/DNA polymerase involved in DNA repair